MSGGATCFAMCFPHTNKQPWDFVASTRLVRQLQLTHGDYIDRLYEGTRAEMNTKRKVFAMLCASGMLIPHAANALALTFNCVTDEADATCAIGEAQLALQVLQGPGTVDFLFQNVGPTASSITDIYFDWLDPDSAFSQGTIVNGPGVSFAWGAAPPNLPGGNGLIPVFTAELSADSDSPAGTHGVNPGEILTFQFQTSLAPTLADLTSGALRVGLRAQGFASGDAQSFVAVPAQPVPEPGTLALLGLGLVGLGLSRRRKA